jgi:hypothetical protein
MATSQVNWSLVSSVPQSPMAIGLNTWCSTDYSHLLYAWSYSTAGEEEKALGMRQKSLVGEDHLDTLKSIHNLAASY